MTGKAYYITTIADWQRHAVRFANSHFIVLEGPVDFPVEFQVEVPASRAAGPAISQPAPAAATPAESPAETNILVLVEADEGVHLSLEDDRAFEALPHPLAQKSISAGAQSALAAHGVAPGATTFDAAESLARIHPLLRHRVF